MTSKQRHEIRKLAEDLALDEFRRDQVFMGRELSAVEVARLEVAVTTAAARAAEAVLLEIRKVKYAKAIQD
jgi:hypothetical protein